MTTTNYTDFIIKVTQQTLEQSLTFRENMDQIWVDATKKIQALSAWEQEIVLDTVETFYTQIIAGSKRVIQIIFQTV